MDKISVGVWTFGMSTERYVSKGYKPFINFPQRVKRIAELDGIHGIEITYPGDVNEDNVISIRKMLDDNGLQVAALGVELVCDAEWQSGSFSSADPRRREKSIQLTKGGMDIAHELGTDVVSLWLGQDGFDYVFQADYQETWQWLIEGLSQSAQHRADIKLGIEYKTSEPKMSGYVNSGGKALALALATGKQNVGITLDVGHAFNARENPAEIASVLMAENRLFHLHLNDNYGISDDDMPVGTVHWPQFIELFYWLQKLNYPGWYSLDIYPYRDDPTEACRASVEFIQRSISIVQQPNFEEELVSLRDQMPGRIIQWLAQRSLGVQEIIK
jgi:xylose isomerase